jgi:Fe-S cluster assembly protein SufD
MSAAVTTDAHLDVLDGIGLPTKRDEAWRYAPHRLLAGLTFGPSTGVPDAVTLDLDARLPVLGGPRIVVVNGVVDRELSTLTTSREQLDPSEADSSTTTSDGVRLSSLADDVAGGSDVAGAHVDRARVTDAFAALNVAYGTDGAVIDVAAGVSLDVPIHVIDVAVPGVAANTSCSGVIVRVGAGGSAVVVESRIAVGNAFGGSNVRTSVVLGDDASLEHVVLQDLAVEQVHLSFVEATLGAGSTLRARSFNLGAAYGRLAYHVDLVGAGAVADLSGLFFGVGEQILDQQITVVHDAPDCTSRQTFRGVLDDASTGVFNGGIDVCPGADGTDAEQSNDNLLLSNRAEVNTQPRLEILADEVACKHGATVGQLDDTALYYLRSRGLNADDARRLLINGFADQIVDDVSVEAVRTWITHRLGHDHD